VPVLVFLAFLGGALLRTHTGLAGLLGARGARPALTGAASGDVLEVGVGKLVPGALLALLAVVAVVLGAVLVRTVLSLLGILRRCH
jgi:hypothetical protein